MNRKSRLTVVFLILYTAPCLSSRLSLSLTLVIAATNWFLLCSIHAIVSEMPLMYGIGFLMPIFVPDNVARNGVTGNLGHSSVLSFFPGVLYRLPCSNPYGLTATYKANKLPGEEVKECFFQCTPLHSSWSSPHASLLPV